MDEQNTGKQKAYEQSTYTQNTNEALTLGSFITQKRLERDKTLRGLAREIGISPVYMCNIEKGRRPLSNEETLENIANVLVLSKDEKALLLDLAAKSKSILVAADLPEYINERDIVRVALRTAKDVDATDEEWQEFIDKLEKRIVRDTPNQDRNPAHSLKNGG